MMTAINTFETSGSTATELFKSAMGIENALMRLQYHMLSICSRNVDNSYLFMGIRDTFSNIYSDM